MVHAMRGPQRVLAHRVPATASGSDPAWTLRSLGQPALRLSPAEPVGQAAVDFNAPPGTRQGGPLWYLGRLHFELELDPSSGPGLVYLSLLTNDRSAILVKFTTGRHRGRLRVRWNTVDLLHGRREHVASSATITAEAKNFLQDRGLRPGANALAFRLERYGRARVRAATILEDSGVISSRLGPAHVRLAVPVHDRDLHVGDTFSVPYAVRSTGDRHPERLRIAASFDHRTLTAIGTTERRLDPRARTSRGRFRFRAARAGTTRVLLAVDSTANRPGAEVAVRVESAAIGGGGRPGRWIGLGALGIALLVAAGVVGLAPPGRRVRAGA
jgi:hypothetical protein